MVESRIAGTLGRKCGDLFTAETAEYAEMIGVMTF